MARARIAAIIPVYEAADHVAKVIASLPPLVHTIVVVDDASPDDSIQRVLALDDPRVDIVRHAHNTGVGGAMLSGYRRALELQADVMVKMDSDGQMDPNYLPALLAPLLTGEADYAKGNRFVHARELGRMPWVRRIGNIGLSFLTKLASGYWHIFDPSNGFTAIHRSAFARLEQDSLARGYYFESSMLVELSVAGAVVRDVDIPARYGDEKSNLSEIGLLVTIPPRLFRGFLRRVWIRHFVRNFGLCAVFGMGGFSLLTFGMSFGLYEWIMNASVLAQPTPIGTVMLAVLPIILGVQLMLQAVVLDIQSTPVVSLTAGERAIAAARAALGEAIEADYEIPRRSAAEAGTPAEPLRVEQPR